MKYWFFLIIAGILEVVWAVGMKYSAGLTKFWPALITIVCMLTGLYFLSLALKAIPLGTAYAVWTGIGTVGTVIFGMFFFKEPASFLRIFFILLIITGISGLYFTNRLS